jgi:hypothetical protein
MLYKVLILEPIAYLYSLIFLSPELASLKHPQQKKATRSRCLNHEQNIDFNQYFV